MCNPYRVSSEQDFQRQTSYKQHASQFMPPAPKLEQFYKTKHSTTTRHTHTITDKVSHIAIGDNT